VEYLCTTYGLFTTRQENMHIIGKTPDLVHFSTSIQRKRSKKLCHEITTTSQHLSRERRSALFCICMKHDAKAIWRSTRMLQHIHTYRPGVATTPLQAGCLKLCAIYDIRTNDLMAQHISRGKGSLGCYQLD